MSNTKTATQGTSIISRFLNKVKTDKRVEFAVYALLGGIALIVFLSSFLGGKSSKTEDPAPAPAASMYDSASVEARLSEILSCIRGAGKVKVMITYESGVETVPALNVDTSSTVRSDSDSEQSDTSGKSVPATVTQDGVETPIVLMELMPKVRGVIVLAEGAADISVRLDLMHAVEAVLGADSSCIEVFELINQN